ncbi:N-acetyl-beta-hexosaminidase [Anaerolinea thermolimosa]|uniref:glycoside hydrolase family 20 zincin-like fold domain-containing protein n=1 Tax=Anaerolinea thermolimosa TaxID=229919 RepID=UPI000782FBE9|nr:glycoside hydrolase family 20 zincin-like fold domain-containing protein [Anaerolinea thermolimosa]GAP06468.1 N-acetyl-beta-hexosaminidase [Anaerolinea thermolimosa]
METLPIFLPLPKKVTYRSGKFHLQSNGLIWLDHDKPVEIKKAALLFKEKLLQRESLQWEIVAGRIPDHLASIVLQINPHLIPYPQGYQIDISPEKVLIIGHDPAGVFYAITTLLQLLQQEGATWPCLEMVDWPDYPVRGVMLDISRDKVYKMETLYELVDRLATWKINQLQLYTEHTFAYRNHPEVWENASPMKGEEILLLDQYCQERFIELVANQNSFGHMERWLKHPRYAHLAEIHGEFEVPWGVMQGPFSLSPVEPGSFELIRSLYDELLPHFTSPMVNVGCDETFDLGAGKSKQICQEKGVGQVYLDYLLKIYNELKTRGKIMQFWGDIIIQHPDLVKQLPEDVIALEWGYEADHPFDEHGELFAASGVPFYVCPGTSSWNSIAGRTDNCLANLSNATRNGLKHGAKGVLNTDWGDNGHWQVLPVSFLGLAMGAANSWNIHSSESIPVKEAISLFAFDDSTGTMGSVMFELGNLYRKAGYEPANASALFGLMQMPLSEIKSHPALNPHLLYQCVEEIQAIIESLKNEKMERKDAPLIREEIQLTANKSAPTLYRAYLCLPQSP